MLSKNNIKKHFLDAKYELLVFVFFVLSRFPCLGHDIFNTDVWKWKSRIFDFGSGVFTMNFEQTLQRYHPGVTLMWLGTIAVKINSFYYKVILGTTPPDNNISTQFFYFIFSRNCNYYCNCSCSGVCFSCY